MFGDSSFLKVQPPGISAADSTTLDSLSNEPDQQTSTRKRFAVDHITRLLLVRPLIFFFFLISYLALLFVPAFIHRLPLVHLPISKHLHLWLLYPMTKRETTLCLTIHGIYLFDRTEMQYIAEVLKYIYMLTEMQALA